MRLDKFLCEVNLGTRSQVKDLIRQGLVAVNGEIVKKADMKIEETADQVCFQGKVLSYRGFVYYLLNKPPGLISATRDDREETVLSLLGDDGREDIFPVGRLDKDTTGLMLLTNDGELAHRLLSPKRHVDKTYRVSLEHSLSQEEISLLERGVDIGEEKPTLPAKVETLDEKTILLTLHEGKYHQVKRMLQAVDNRVVALKRVSFGNLVLEESLTSGSYRELTAEEVAGLKSLVC